MDDEQNIHRNNQCCCNEVTLITENEPEVLNFGEACPEEVDFVSPGEPIVIMFDEETEMYYSDIVHTREVVDEMRDTLDNHTTKLNNIQSTANTNQTKINAVKTVVDGIASDMSSVAKQGSNSEATNTKILEANEQVLRAFLEKTHFDYGDSTPNRIYVSNNAFDLIGYVDINSTMYSVWVCTRYAGLWMLYVTGTPTIGTATYQMINGTLSEYYNITSVETVVLATEANATANKEAIIEAVNNAQPDLSSVAKQGANADATNTAILDAVRQGGGGGGVALTPFVKVDGSDVIFSFVTLQQMENMSIGVKIGSQSGRVTFTLTTNDSDFYLRFSNTSPQEIAGELVLDDSVDMLYYIFGELRVSLPSNYTVDYVYLGDIDANLLEADINWRLADLQKRIGEGGEDPNSKALAEFFGVTLLEGYEFMTDTEVCDELEDIMRVIDPTLTAAQAAAITAQTLNPSES